MLTPQGTGSSVQVSGQGGLPSASPGCGPGITFDPATGRVVVSYGLSLSGFGIAIVSTTADLSQPWQIDGRNDNWGPLWPGLMLISGNYRGQANELLYIHGAQSQPPPAYLYNVSRWIDGEGPWDYFYIGVRIAGETPPIPMNGWIVANDPFSGMVALSWADTGGNVYITGSTNPNSFPVPYNLAPTGIRSGAPAGISVQGTSVTAYIAAGTSIWTLEWSSSGTTTPFEITDFDQLAGTTASAWAGTNNFCAYLTTAGALEYFVVAEE